MVCVEPDGESGLYQPTRDWRCFLLHQHTKTKPYHRCDLACIYDHRRRLDLLSKCIAGCQTTDHVLYTSISGRYITKPGIICDRAGRNDFTTITYFNANGR